MDAVAVAFVVAEADGDVVQCFLHLINAVGGFVNELYVPMAAIGVE